MENISAKNVFFGLFFSNFSFSQYPDRITRIVFLVIAFLVITTGVAKSQKQGNIWYFAEYAGLDFSSGVPVPITGGQIYSATSNSEGCSVISDSAGNLLLYATPTTVWNRNHEVMPNGNNLQGGISSTQGVLIIPKPGSNELFYVFTQDEFQNNLANGLRYSVVDLCLDGGLGDVVSNEKNIFLLDSVGEKLTAAFHSNGTDIWLVTRKHFTNEFYSFLITTNGISSPAISSSGWGNPLGEIPNSIGQMKISPDGSKLAFAAGNQVPDVAQLFNFNNSTGEVNGVIDLPLNQFSGNPYGVAFSPDNSKLYIRGPAPTGLVQFDLSTGDSATIVNSMISINAVNGSAPYGGTGLQLANDGKIYVSGANGYINVIHEPNESGDSCYYEVNAIVSSTTYTFPGFIDSYKYKNGIPDCTSNNFSSTASELCEKFCTSFFDQSNNNPTSWQWLFPGGSPSSSTDQNPAGICYNTPGTYDVTLITTGGGGNDTLITPDYITVNPTPPAPVITQAGYTLTSSAASSYQWQLNTINLPGATNQSYTVLQSGFYTVIIGDSLGCVNSTSVTVTISGIDEISHNAQILISPNPSNGNFTLEFLNGLTGDKISIDVMNTFGQIIFSWEESRASTNGRKEISLNNLPVGIYFIEIKPENEDPSFIRVKKKIIVAR